MPPCCIVPFCSTRRSGHRFPKDEQLRQKWIVAIRRDKFFKPTKFSRVCTKHFVRADYRMPLDSVLKNPDRRLKKDAVPNQFLWNKGTTSTDEETPEVEMEVDSRWSPKKRRRNAFVDTEDDSDISDEDSRPSEVWTRCGKKFIALGSSSLPADQRNHLTPLPVKENFPEEMSSIMRNTERNDHTYSQRDLPIASKPQGHTDKGIRLKNSKDLLQQPTMTQTTNRINEVSSQFQADGSLLDTSHFQVVVEQIQNTLDNMSREELVAFYKMKIEDEVRGKAEKIERENQINQLEASLLASKAELSTLQTKNTELKFTFSTIYREYKKETNRTTQTPRFVFKDAKVPDKPPIVLIRLNKRPLGFRLSDNRPQDNSEFITGDVQTEFPKVPILPLNLETVPEILTTIMQEDLTCDKNCTPEILTEIKQENLTCDKNCIAEILTEIKQENLTCDKNCTPEILTEIKQEDLNCVPPPSVNPANNLVISTPHCHNPTPSSLATINGNNNQQQSTATNTTKTFYNNHHKERSQTQNDSLDIEDRIPHALITCKSVQNYPALVTSISSKVDTQLSIPQPPSTNNVKVFKVLLNLTNEQRTSEQKATQKTTTNDMNNCFPRIVSTQSLAPQSKVSGGSAKPPVNLTNLSNSPALNNTDIPSIQNSFQVLIPGSSSSNLLDSSGETILKGANPMQIAYIVNGAPGSRGPQQKYFKTSETGSPMIPQISNVTSLGKSVHGAVKHANSVGTEVFDLTDDASNNKSENIPRLVYRFKTSADRNGGLDNKFLVVKKRVLKKIDPAQIPADLDKIALVKLPRKEKMASDSKDIVTPTSKVDNINVSLTKKNSKLPNILKKKNSGYN